MEINIGDLVVLRRSYPFEFMRKGDREVSRYHHHHRKSDVSLGRLEFRQKTKDDGLHPTFRIMRVVSEQGAEALTWYRVHGSLSTVLNLRRERKLAFGVSNILVLKSKHKTASPILASFDRNRKEN